MFRKRLVGAFDPDTCTPVKVTVIDTGIDATHPFIQSTGWVSDDPDTEIPRFQDFCGLGEKDPVDEDGHGSFVAGVLLQAAPDIELFVARIGTTREDIKKDAHIEEKIAQVKC
jgi:hypothetical protein